MIFLSILDTPKITFKLCAHDKFHHLLTPVGGGGGVDGNAQCIVNTPEYIFGIHTEWLQEEIPKERDLAASFLDQYFAKYLTNQNLLSLQLNDSNFR